MKIKILAGIALILPFIFFSCGSNSKNSSETTLNHFESIDSEPEPIVYEVQSKSTLYAEPKQGSVKLINQKATEALGKTQYLEIDPSCRIVILEESQDWAKIQVVDPSLLKDSHIGWVKKDCIKIDIEESDTEEPVYEENKDYQVLYTKTMGVTDNIHVYLLKKTTDEKELASIAKYIKKQHGGKCNVNLYDSSDIVPLIDKYPIKGQEYVKLADHFLYMLSFDGTGMYYPFKDELYKQYGGKKPIKR